MIPSIELRIGNWVTNAKGKLYQLTSGADIDKASSYTPVIINNQVLEKCGFIFDAYFLLWQKKTIPTNAIEMEMDASFHIRDFGHRYIGVKASYVHQVQNLYFALKLKELDTSQLKNKLVIQ